MDPTAALAPIAALLVAAGFSAHTPATTTTEAPSAVEDAVPATADPATVNVPPGSPADRALWRRAYDLDNEIPIERSVASRLQLHARTRSLLPRLSELGARGALEPKRAAELAGRLREEWDETVELLVVRWPVDPTRVCGYDLLTFESVMRSDVGAQRDAQLAESRAALERCLTTAQLPLRAMRRANAGLRETIEEVERAISAAAPAPATAGAR